MPEQRQSDPSGRPLTRRGFLATAAAATAVTGGCTALGQSDGVSVLAAGSLQPALADLRDAVDVPLRGEAMGSVAAARLVASGKRDPDIVALADTALFDRLGTWYARFATNAMAVAYTESTAGGRAVASADRWFDPVLAGEASLGRTDPALDPLGYRTLFTVGLAAEYYDRPGLTADLLAPDQVYPETALLSQFETGGIDAAVVYRSMAVDRGYPRIDLPAAIDLSAPAQRENYRRERYQFPDGGTVRGDVIEYGATLRHDRGPARGVFDVLVAGDWFDDHGFARPESYPTYVGEPPDGLA